MDNKKDIGSSDRDRINVHEDYELQEWATSLGVTKEQIKEAVEAVGTSAEKVREYLKK